MIFLKDCVVSHSRKIYSWSTFQIDGSAWSSEERRAMKLREAKEFLASIADRHPEWVIRKARS